MRLWIILLIAVAAAVAVAAPIVIPKQLPPVRVPVNHVQYRTLHTVKPWSDNVVVYVDTNYIPDSVTHAWTNVTLYYHPPWSARHVATVTPAMQRVTVLYVFSTPTFVAVNPVVVASAGVNVWIAIIANATRPDTTLYCEVGMEFAGGRIIACLHTTATGSLQYVGWLNVSYVTSIAVAAFSTADYISSAGAVLDVSRTVWVTDPGLTVPATPRRPVYAAIANVSGVIVSATPNPSAVYIDPKTMTTTLVYENVVWTNDVTINGTHVWVKYRYALSVPHPVTLTHTYIDGSESSATVQSAGDYYVIDDYDAPLYIVASVGSRTAKIFAPGFDEHIRLAPIPSTQTPVTFYVYDYGQGFTQLRVYAFDGRLVWRDVISTATQSVVANLQPYDAYVIALWKPNIERALGPITIDKTAFTLTVLPAPQPVPQMPFASVTYNQTIAAYIIDVYCRLPPCNITLTKMTVGSTSVVSFVCTSAYCRFTWQTEDPFLRVTVTDASGNTYNAFAGTSLNMTPSQVESFQRVFGKIAEHFAMFDNANGVKFAAALLGVLIFLALTIPGFLMVGLIVLAIYNAVVGMLLGFTLLSATALPIIVIIGILHYIAKHA